MMDPIFKENNFQSVRFDNEEGLNDYNDKNANLIAGIIFEENLFTYTIRINGTEVTDPELQPISNYGMTRAGTSDGLAYLNKFSYIQSVVDSSIISVKTNNPISIKTTVGSMSKPSINYSAMNESGSKINSMYMNFIFFAHIIIIVTFMVEEKEKKIKEGMLMSGVHSTVFWLSWEIIYTIIIAVTSVIITVLFIIFKSFEYTNPVILFIIVTLFGLSNCGLGFVFSTFFKKAKTAASFAGMTTTFICIAYMAVSYFNKNVKLFFSLILSPVAMGNVMEEIGRLNDMREKITFGNLFKNDVGLYILILLFNNFLYFGLSILFEYLFDDYSTLRLKRTSKLSAVNDPVNIYEQDIEEDSRKDEKCTVEISNVSKVFEKDATEDEIDDTKKGLFSKKNTKQQFLAVNHVSFKVYNDEIFCILGHNGAGKTTLIQIMIGLINASGGNVYFDGADITKNTTQIRTNFGKYKLNIFFIIY